MFEDYIPILSLLKEAGKIATRKKIQKIVFFLKQIDAPFNEKFSLHHYGPYSPELQIELDQLEDLGFIKQSYNNNTYEFLLDEEGEKLLNQYPESSKKVNTELFIKLIGKLNLLQPYLLESMSTIVYFEKSYGQNKESVKEAVCKLKPHLKDIFDDAWDKLKELELHAEKDT